MSDRPSDGMALDELRDEFDWIIEFQGRMAERICGDADVHNLADYVSKLEVDNAKLRELCKRFSDYVSHDRCEGCVYKSRCNDGLIDECWQLTEIRKLASELGVEVDG